MLTVGKMEYKILSNYQRIMLEKEIINLQQSACFVTYMLNDTLSPLIHYMYLQYFHFQLSVGTGVATEVVRNKGAVDNMIVRYNDIVINAPGIYSTTHTGSCKFIYSATDVYLI